MVLHHIGYPHTTLNTHPKHHDLAIKDLLRDSGFDPSRSPYAADHQFTGCLDEVHFQTGEANMQFTSKLEKRRNRNFRVVFRLLHSCLLELKGLLSNNLGN